jgi:cytochrome c biogenesis protein CcmG/thiol:disulfide interchange protein DsbE
MRVARLTLMSLAALWAVLCLLSCSGDGNEADSSGMNNRSTSAASVSSTKAPGFALRSLDGKTVNFSQFQGKVVLVDFWASWCRPCRRSIPDLNSLYQKYSPEGFEVVGISLDKSGTSRLQEFAKKIGITYTVVMGSREIAQRWDTGPAIPVAYLVDREGEIVGKYVGLQDKTKLEDEILRYL